MIERPLVMAALVAAIHKALRLVAWMAGSRPAMT